MDINTLRSLMTLISFLTFVAIIVWAFKRSNRAAFEEAGRLPLLDDEPVAAERSRTGSHS